ncbi:NAD-dependent epimerase/dehydratase family protein [Magnetovibrio sp.]|uniref:NAD-dependent epimerase/dehydratase family protein n=1 Tax=Magnetovibrio sp. TaxID=2024836 RepID=UPI002F93F4C6
MRNRIIEDDLSYIVNADLPWQELTGKTVLISGAAGFLISYVVHLLLFLNEKNDANIKIIGLVRDAERAREKYASVPQTENLLFISQDVCDEISIDEKIDYIIHAASYATPKVFRDNPVGTILPNVIGTKNLLELAVKNDVDGFLFFSTSGVYGHVADEDYPVPETCFGGLDPMELSSCYLESKRMGENMCVAWMHQYGVPIKIVRPAITYGPGLDLDGGRSFEDFIACIVRKQDITLYSDGRAIRNFCYIADATLGFFTVLLKGENGQAYNVATDHEISIKDLAQYLVDDVFPERNLKVISKFDTSKDYLRTQFSRTTVDISKIRALGWTLSFPIAPGFKKVVQSFEDH